MKRFLLLFSFFLLMSCEVMPPTNTIYRRLPPNTGGTSLNENKEFATLIENDQINKKRVNAEVLTYLLNDSDSREKQTAAVIENTSRCDIILRLVRLSNDKIYNLPIRRNSKNQFVIEKGKYTLKSNICGANYYSQKEIIEPLILKLSNN